MSHDEDYGFWDDDRSYSLSGQRARHHGPVRQHASVQLRGGARTASDRASLSLFWSRIGLLALVGVVAIGVALAVSSGGSLGRAAAVAAQVAPATPVAETVLAQVVTISPTLAAPFALAEVPAAVVEVPTTVQIAATPTAAPPVHAATVAAMATVAATAVPAAKVAAAKVKMSCAKTYKVVALDYWILIAQKAHVSVKELLAANNAKTTTALFPGRTVCLPANASTPKVAAATTTTATKPKSTVKVTPTAKAAAPTTTIKPKSKTTSATQPALPEPPPLRSYSAAEVEQIIRDVWPDDLEDRAVAIAKRESNLRPVARNWCCIGLFQIYWSANQRFLSTIGITSASMLFDPVSNANAAYAMYLRSGWGPWS